MGLKRAYFKINYRLYVYFYRAITPIKYLLLLLSSVNICYLPSHFIYLLYLPQCSDFKNRSHRMEKGYQWKRIFLSPGKTKLNKTFEHSSWGEKNILNFCEGNILALSFAWNFFFKNLVSSPFSHRVLWQHSGLWHGDRGLFKGPRVLNREPWEGGCCPSAPERTATSGAPQRYRLMHPAIKFLLTSRVLRERCISITKVGIESSACWKTFFPVHSQVPLSDHVGSVACFF